MACGTPVMTSSTGAAPEIAGGAAILVDPFDINSMQEGIERLTQPEESTRLCGLGAERARSFTWSAAAEATIESYRQALDVR